MPETDLELVRRTRHGELEAFHELVDRHGAYLYGLAVSLLGSTTDAEDAVQETLTGAFRGLASFREQASVKTWLTRILVRQTARHFRRRGSPRIGSLSPASTPEPAVTAATGGSDARLDVQRAIRLLQPEHRDVVVLRELQGLSYDEISQVLDIPQGTVESRLFRARRELQRLLRDYLT